MKKLKIIFKLMVFSLIIGNLLWINSTKSLLAATKAQIKIDNVNTRLGDTFEVTVSFSSAQGVGGMELKIPYNTQQFEFVSGETIIKASQFDVNDENGVINVVSIFESDVTSNEIKVLKLKFKAKDNAISGKYEIKCSEGELVNGSDYANIAFDSVAGSISINNVQKGDIDNNGKINITDAMRIFHYVSGRNRTLSDMQISAADINGDGKINITDAMKVFHYVSGRIKTLDTNISSSITVTGISLNKTSLKLSVGETTSLIATIQPNNATNKNVTWSSSNINIATVDASGKVIAKAAGSSNITVKTNDGGKISTCTVTVAASTVSVTGVSISNKKGLTLDCNDSKNKTYQCKVSVEPSNASNKTVTWSSNNTSVATVDSNGKITANAVGKATITVKTADGAKTDTINVYVYKSNADVPNEWQGGNKYVKFRLAANRDLFMDVNDAKTFNGAKVQLWTNNDSNAQKWQLHNYKSLHGGFAVVPKCNSGAFILDANRGGNNLTDPLKAGCKIDVWTLGQDDAASMWQLVKLWDDGAYMLKLKNTNFTVGTTSATKGTQLTLKQFDAFDTNQVWIAQTVTVASANDNITPNLNSASYNSANPFYPTYGGQCTAFVWGRAHEKLGISLPFRNDAITFWTQNVSGKYYSYGSTPKANSIAVWNDGGTGHVAFVEKVSGDNVTINEANFNTFKSTNYGGGYDGAPKTLTTSQMKSHHGKSFMGYIYLQ